MTPLVLPDPTQDRDLCVLCGNHLTETEPGPECRPCAEGPYWVVPGPREVHPPYRLPGGGSS